MEAGGKGMSGEKGGVSFAAASQRDGGRIGKAADAGKRQAGEASVRERGAELRLETFLLDRLLCLVTVVLEPDLDLRRESKK